MKDESLDAVETTPVSAKKPKNKLNVWIAGLAAGCLAAVVTVAVALQPTTVSLNSAIQVDGLVYVIHGAGSQRAVDYPPTQTTAPSDVTFVLVDTSVVNKGEKVSTDIGRGFTLSDFKGRHYSRSNLGEGAYIQLGQKHNKEFIVSQLTPGESKRAKLVFEVPASDWNQDLKLLIPSEGFINNKPVSVTLN